MRKWLRRERPTAGQVMLATGIGAMAVVVVNAVAIEIAVPLPAQGWSLRVAHHAFGALHVLGLGFAWAAVAGICASRRWPRAWIGWALLAVLAALATDWALGQFVARKAYSLLGAAAAELIYRVIIALYGVGIALTYWVGLVLGKRPFLRWLLPAVGLAALVVNQLVLLDEYQGVHTVIAWAAACLLGAGLVARSGTPADAAQRRTIGAIGLFSVAATLVWHPPNAVRLELFRHAGAATSYVLARALWPLPQLAADAPPEAAAGPTSQPAGAAQLTALVERPVVVLITIDAMRGDLLAERGHEAELPSLVRLRDGGAFFRRAWAPGSQTSTSLTTIFSGRYFSQLRWQRIGAYVYPKSDPSPRFPALLSEHGVRTHSYLGLDFIDGAHGVVDGIQLERVRPDGRGHLRAAQVIGPLLSDLRAADRSLAHFFYAHLTEPHEPYDLGSKTRGPALDRYVSEVAVAGRWIARVAQALETRWRGRGILIVASDHGEAFGEHGTFFHSRTLYQELLHVPLIFWGAGITPRTVDARVGLVDLGPTILEIFGHRAPDSFMGRSLLPVLRGARPAGDRTLYAEGRRRRAMLTPAGLKVIEDTRLKTDEVYDLAQDPKELRNLFDVDPLRAHPAVARARAFFERNAYRARGYETPYKR